MKVRTGMISREPDLYHRERTDDTAVCVRGAEPSGGSSEPGRKGSPLGIRDTRKMEWQGFTMPRQGNIRWMREY